MGNETDDDSDDACIQYSYGFDSYTSHSDYEADTESDNDGKEKVKGRGRPKGTKRKADHEVIKERKRKKYVESNKLASVYCCVAFCLMTLVPLEAVVTFRHTIENFSTRELNQWLLDWMWIHSSTNGDVCYMIGEWKICFSAFLMIIGIPLSTYYYINKKFKDYSHRYADRQPDQVKLHLPSCLTKDTVYSHYKDDMDLHEMEVVSLSHFYKIWRESLGFVSIPPSNRLSKCKFCTEIKIDLGKTKGKNERKKLISKRQIHLDKQRNEREKYYKHAQKARANPERYMSIILDGMDQKKTEVPHFIQNTSFTNSMWKLRSHLIGVIAHGRGIYGYFDSFQFPHGSNLTIHCLMQTLLQLKHSLPDILYLQMDNCSRENKNRYLFAFLCYLVEKKMFKKIKISFLMVGHTHEDIDQLFSRLSVWLKRNTAATLECLKKGFEQSFTPSPKAFDTINVFDVTTWLQKFISPMTGHSKPHAFRIKLDENGKAVMHFKLWANGKKREEWKPTSGDSYFLHTVPTSEPTILKENWEKIDLDTLSKDMIKCGNLITDVENQWWTNFFSKKDVEGDNCNQQNLHWMMDDLLRAKENSSHIVDDVQEAANEEDDVAEDICEIVVGKKKKSTDKGVTMQIGDEGVCGMALLNLPKYAGEWPQVAEIVSVGVDVATVKWYKGSKTTSWKECMITIPGQKGKKQLWLEDVPIDFIWHHGFKLTSTGKLPKSVKNLIDEFQDY